MDDNFILATYLGEEHEYSLRTCAASTFWVDITVYEGETGNWKFDTKEEAIAFINGYELGTGAQELPRLYRVYHKK